MISEAVERLLERAVLLELIRGAVVDQLPFMDHQDAVGHRVHLAQDVGRDQHRLEPDRFVVFVIEGDLCLAVGAKIGHRARSAHFGQALSHSMGQVNGQRHEHIGLATGVTKHHSLIAGPLLIVGIAGSPGATHLFGLVHSLGNVR